jgi:hypothetical protein
VLTACRFEAGELIFFPFLTAHSSAL